MSIYDDVAELIWENGQLSMHGLGGLHYTSQEKPTLSRARDTLESVVQQGTLSQQQRHHQKSKKYNMKDHNVPPLTSVSSIGAASSGELQAVPTLSRKRAWSSNSDTNNNMLEECGGHGLPSGGCAAASAGGFCRDNDTTMMTWTSLESGRSFKSKTLEEDSACHCGSDIRDSQDDRDSKAEIGQTNSKRRNRTAAIHNQSERRRRDRINQKMKALQRLVPNASKTDKASMLDEVINYLKQLQAQIQMMNMTSMPQMMLPLAMQQQQLQMSLLARMRMGMLNINNMASPHTGATRSFPQLIQPTTVGAPPLTAASMFVAPSFLMPSLIQARALAPPKPDPAASSATNASIPLPDPYSTSLTQPINMDILNNMAALYWQQMSQNNHALSSNLSQLHHEQGD